MVKKGLRSFEAESLNTRTDKRQKRKAKEDITSNRTLLVLVLCVRFVAVPVSQELASTATSEPIHNNNTDIIEIDEFTTMLCFAGAMLATTTNLQWIHSFKFERGNKNQSLT